MRFLVALGIVAALLFVSELVLVSEPGHADGPAITPTITAGTTGDNGWYRSAVTVQIAVTGATDTTCPAVKTFTATTSPAWTCTATAGPLSQTLTLNFKIDGDPPTVSGATPDRAPDQQRLVQSSDDRELRRHRRELWHRLLHLRVLLGARRLLDDRQRHLPRQRRQRQRARHLCAEVRRDTARCHRVRSTCARRRRVVQPSSRRGVLRNRLRLGHRLLHRIDHLFGPRHGRGVDPGELCRSGRQPRGGLLRPALRRDASDGERQDRAQPRRPRRLVHASRGGDLHGSRRAVGPRRLHGRANVRRPGRQRSEGHREVH